MVEIPDSHTIAKHRMHIHCVEQCGLTYVERALRYCGLVEAENRGEEMLIR